MKPQSIDDTSPLVPWTRLSAQKFLLFFPKNKKKNWPNQNPDLLSKFVWKSNILPTWLSRLIWIKTKYMDFMAIFAKALFSYANKFGPQRVKRSTSATELELYSSTTRHGFKYFLEYLSTSQVHSSIL